MKPILARSVSEGAPDEYFLPLPRSRFLKLRKTAAERRHRIAWGASPRKSWSNQIPKAPEGRHRMTSHGVAPPGLSAGKMILSLGLAPQAIRCRPSGTKKTQLQNLRFGLGLVFFNRLLAVTHLVGPALSSDQSSRTTMAIQFKTYGCWQIPKQGFHKRD